MMGKKLLVSPFLMDPAVFHHIDPVCVHDSAEPVGDDDQGLALCESGDGPLDHGFILRICIGRRLIQDDHRGRLQHSPGDGNALALSAGEMAAGAADHGLVALFQAHDEIMTAAHLRGLLHLFIRGGRPAQPDVFPDRHIEEIIVL